jgi:hypothetical protein
LLLIEVRQTTTTGISHPEIVPGWRTTTSKLTNPLTGPRVCNVHFSTVRSNST